MKVLVDTNIVLDLLTDRLPFSKAARKIFATAEQWKMDLFITASSVTDIFYIVRKHTDRKKAEEILVQLLDIVKIIEVTGKDIKKALTLDFNDFEDALQARCAKKRKLDFIITRNKKDFA
ncbi:MAG TPA: PIN domain-containing protein, partial [Nitrospirae bacterium]|nr:PIN domain-containing protein [Nitrospirota bacterium]